MQHSEREGPSQVDWPSCCDGREGNFCTSSTRSCRAGTALLWYPARLTHKPVPSLDARPAVVERLLPDGNGFHPLWIILVPTLAFFRHLKLFACSTPT